MNLDELNSLSDGEKRPDLITVAELAIELRLAKVTIYKRLGKWDKEQGVVRQGSRYTRIRRSVFMPLWFAGEIPW